MSSRPFILVFLGILALIGIIGLLLRLSGFTSPAGPPVPTFLYEQPTTGPSGGQTQIN